MLADVEGWFPLAGVTLDVPTIDAVVDEVGAALEPFVTPGGVVEFPVSAHLVTATKS